MMNGKLGDHSNSHDYHVKTQDHRATIMAKSQPICFTMILALLSYGSHVFATWAVVLSINVRKARVHTEFGSYWQTQYYSKTAAQIQTSGPWGFLCSTNKAGF